MKRRISLAATTLAAFVISTPSATVMAQDAPRAPAVPPTPKKAPPRRPVAPPAPPPSDDAENEADEAPPEPPEAEEAPAEDADGATPDEHEEGAEDALPPDEDEPDDEPATESSDEEVAVPSPPKRKRKHKRRRRPPAASPAAKSKRQMPYELTYVEGMDIPDGYTKVDETRTGLVIAGAITFGVGWLAAATAAVAYSDEDHGCFGGAYSYEGEDDHHEYYDGLGCGRGTEAEDFAPLYIPIAGPFIAMGTLDHADGGVRAALLLDGVVQVGGAAMFIAGLVAKKSVLIRTKHATMTIAPGPGSVQLVGSF